MKALAVFPAKKNVLLIEKLRPESLKDNKALLKVVDVGLCGTDREISSFAYGTPPQGSDHLILGHESLAEVVEVGAEVRNIKTGDLVVAMVRRPCVHAECLPCRARRPDFCVTGDYTERGIKGQDGFLTEYVVDDAAYLIPVPRVLADVAVLIEPLTVASKAGFESLAIIERLPYKPIHRRGLSIGAGPVGLLGAMLLAAEGWETVVYSREAEESSRADLVRSFGASYVSAGKTPLDKITERVGAFDVVFEAVGAAQVMVSASAALGPNGVLVLTGIPSEESKAELNAGRMLRNLVLKNQVLFGTVNAGEISYTSAIQWLQQFMTLFPESVRRLITRRLSLEEAPDALSSHEGIKNVVQLSRAA